MGCVNGVVFVEICRDCDEVMGSLCELRNIRGEGYFVKIGEIWGDEVQSVLGDIEADGGEDFAKAAEKLFANVANTDNADDNVRITLDCDPRRFTVVINLVVIRDTVNC